MPIEVIGTNEIKYSELKSGDMFQLPEGGTYIKLEAPGDDGFADLAVDEENEEPYLASPESPDSKVTLVKRNVKIIIDLSEGE